MAPDLVGDDPRVCQCGECRSFPSPAKKHKMGKYGPSVAWRGRWWWQTKAGYHRNQKAGGLLHRKIYETHVGPIPEGFDVHHVDEDTFNNRTSNFELLTRSDHNSRHIAADGRVGFNRFRPETKLCVVCGDAFTALVPARALYCSTTCKSAFWTARRYHKHSAHRGAE